MNHPPRLSAKRKATCLFFSRSETKKTLFTSDLSKGEKRRQLSRRPEQEQDAGAPVGS